MLPDPTELDRLTRQIESAGIAVERGATSALVLDPWRNRVKLTLPDPQR